MSKSLGNVIDPMEVIHGCSLNGELTDWLTISRRCMDIIVLMPSSYRCHFPPSDINDGLQLSPPSLHDNSIEEGGYMAMPSSTDDDDHRDLFVHREATTAVTAEQHKTTLSLASRLTAIKGRMRAVGTCTSINSQLYMLSALLLLGLAITMIITVTLVDTEGQSWTDESGSNLGEDTTYYRSTYMLVLVIASRPL